MVLKSLLGKSSPFTTECEPDLHPTRGPGLDAQAIPLMLLNMLDYDVRVGYRHTTLLMMYTYCVEDHLEDNGIEVNRYNWNIKEDAVGRAYPYSEQLKSDLWEGYPNNEPPAIHTQDSATFGGKPIRYNGPNGYTDLFIAKYFEHADADRSDVKDLINQLLDEIPDKAQFMVVHERLVETNPGTFY